MSVMLLYFEKSLGFCEAFKVDLLYVWSPTNTKKGRITSIYFNLYAVTMVTEPQITNAKPKSRGLFIVVIGISAK